MQLDLFYEDKNDVVLEELYEAYLDCRKNKRNKLSSLEFELNLESNLFSLYDDLITSSYEFRPSTVFMVEKPVKREIFAANFRDRIIHHFLINKLNPHFENLFLDNSYACRVGKGTHYGIEKVRLNMEKVSEGYTLEAWILKLDIKGFFMHINRGILKKRLIKYIEEVYKSEDKPLVMSLLNKIVSLDPAENCYVKGNKKEWLGLPRDKSIFHSPKGCGLPIGNLTSQVFANFYLHLLDEFVVNTIGVKEYGRYVDDFVLVHKDKEYLKECLARIKTFLTEDLELTLHPKKIYLQKVEKGVPYLGVFIRPGRIYCGNRMKAGFYDSIVKYNKLLKSQGISDDLIENFISSLNSYLGMMSHYDTYKIRRKLLSKNLAPYWWGYVAVTNIGTKFVRIRRRKAA
jgi:retron-type reverse transcriptase